MYGPKKNITGPVRRLSKLGGMSKRLNDNNEFWLDEREYFISFYNLLFITLFHFVRFTLFTNSLVFGLCHLILRLYKNFTKSEMPRGCKLPWVMYGELVINLTSNEMKQFDWTTSVWAKCMGQKRISQAP